MPAKAKQEKKSAPDLSSYLEKEATTAQARFADWLIENVGIDPSEFDPDAAFREGVRLAKALIMVYQASPENKEATAAERAARLKAAQTRKDELAAKRKEKAAEAEGDEKPAGKAKTAKAAPKKATPAKASAKPKPRARSGASKAAF